MVKYENLTDSYVPTSMTRAGSHSRVFGLDVLRAFAILLVLASHFGQAIPWWFGPRWGASIPTAIGAYGTTGVVVFFALSGFLVGGIALRAMKSAPQPRSIAVFLIRRWMRTMPLYWTAMVLYLLLEPPSNWLAHAARYATFTQNLLIDMPLDRWFAVSWSLSVEEWFYLMVGLFGFSLAMLMRVGLAAWLTIALLIAGPMWLRWSSPRQDWFSYATIYWFDAIAFGMALARIVSRLRIPWWISAPLALAGLWCGWVVDSNQLALPAHAFVTLMPTTLATGATLLIPLALCWRESGGWPARLVQWVSTRSYGLYLFHAPLLGKVTAAVTATSQLGGGASWEAIALGLIATSCLLCILAEIAHRFIERPLMQLRPH